MRITHALATAGLTTAMALGTVAPADAAPRKASAPCTYEVDEAAGTLSGECHQSTWMGSVDAEFSGTYDDGSASGSFTLSSWLGDWDGTFTATGLEDGSGTISYTVQTPYGPYSGTYTAQG
jgi:hypothetical protein